MAPLSPQPTSQDGAKPANPPAADQKPEVQKELKLDGTAKDSPIPIQLPETLPAAAPGMREIESRFGKEQAAKYSTSFAAIDSMHKEVSDYAHYLSKADFASCGAVIKNCNQELAAALARGDQKRYEQMLEYLKAQLTSLKTFIDYEKSQGLAGVCADSGVRIYLRGDKIWLCTPDAKAFKDLNDGQKAELRNFVKGLTGVNVDFNSAKFQDQKNSGTVALLGCRLDELKLQTLRENEKYRLETKVRSGNEFKDTLVCFSWADLRAGKVSGLFGHDERLPVVNDPTKVQPNAQAGKEQRQEAIDDAKRLATEPARMLPLVAKKPATPVPQPKVAETKPATPATPEPVKVLDPVHEQALKARSDLRAKAATDMSNIDTPEKAVAQLKEFEATQKAYDEALKKQRALLEEQKAKSVAGTEPHTKATAALKDLDSAAGHDLMVRRQLLEKQLASTDPATKLSAQRSIAKMAKAVDKVYADQLAAEGLADSQKTTLQAEREAFAKQAAECDAATKGNIRKLADLAGEKLKTLGTAIETRYPAVSKIKGYAVAVRDYVSTQVEKWRAPKVETPDTTVAPKVKITPPATQPEALQILQDRHTARMAIDRSLATTNTSEAVQKALAELDRSQPAYDQAVKSRQAHLEAQKANNPWASAERQQAVKLLGDLERMKARDLLVRKELLQKQVDLADPAAKPAAQKALVKAAPQIDKAYEKLMSDSTVSEADKAKFKAERETLANQVKDIETTTKSGFRRWAERTLTRLQDAAKVEIKLPGTSRIKGFFADWAEKVAMSDALEVPKTVAGKTVDAMTAKERAAQLKSLEEKSAKFKSQIEKLAANASDPAVATKLAQLKDADAVSITRRAEILEQQLAEASDPKQVAKIRETLHANASEIEGAYRHQGNAAAADAFAQRIKTAAPEVDWQTRVKAVASDPKVAAASTKLQKVEAELAKAVAGSPEAAELAAMKSIAVASEQLAVAEAEFAALQEKHSKGPMTDVAEKEIATKRAEVVKLREGHAAERVKFAELRIQNVDARLTAIDAEIKASASDPAKITKLEIEKRNLIAKRAEFIEKFEMLKAEGYSGPLKQDLVKLNEDLKKATADSKVEKDEAKRSALEQQVVKLKREILEAERQLHDIECRNHQAQKAVFEKMVLDLDAKIAEQKAAGKPDEVKALERSKKALESKIRTATDCAEYHAGERKILDAKMKIDRTEAGKAKMQTELEGLKKLSALDDTQKARVTKLESNIKVIDENLVKSQAELVASQKELKVTTSRKLSMAVERCNARLQGMGDWAQKNPMRAATYFGMLGEGLRNATTAKYTDDAKHTAIPTLLLLLDSDLSDGFMGQNVHFKTKDYGVFASAGAEFISGAGNVPIVMGGFYTGQKALAATVGRTRPGAWVGTKLSTVTAGRVFAFGGAALDGFLTFHDYHSWKDDNMLQTTGKVASPIVIGAGFGAFFGPPGAALGALGGAVGEFGGLVWAANSLDAELAKDWRKRGVRDSIRQAEQGYVFAKDSEQLRGRSRDLQDYEKEAIDELTKQRVLGQMFASKGGWSHDDLQKLGFRVDNSDEAGQHNWARLESLLEPPKYRWVYNLLGEKVRIWESESVKAQEAHSDLWHKLHWMRAEHENYYRDRYFEAPRASYESKNESSTLSIAFLGGSSNGTIIISNERADLFRNAAAHFNSELKQVEDEIKLNGGDRRRFSAQIAEAQWQTLLAKYPQLGLILSTENGRDAFFAQFQSASGVDLRTSEFWTHKALCPTGIGFCAQIMPEELKSIPKAGLAAPIDDVQKLADELLKE